MILNYGGSRLCLGIVVMVMMRKKTQEIEDLFSVFDGFIVCTTSEAGRNGG